MASVNAELIIRLVDRVSGPARGIAASLRGIGVAARSLGGLSFGSIGRQMARDAGQIKRAMHVVGGAFAPIAGGFGLYKLHSDVLEFAKATNRLAAANPDVAAEHIREIKDLAREITRTSVFDPATVMNAANALARADVSIEAIKGSLRPLAHGAMAADVPISQLADDFVKLASNFNLPIRTKEQAKETFGYLADLSTYVGQKAPGTFTDFVQAMKQVGPAVTALGVKIEWLAGAYILLDKAGVRNEEAGVALKSLFKAIVQPTASARGQLAQLGIDPSQYTKRGAVSGDQLVRRIAAEYGKDFSRLGPELQRVLDKGGTQAQMHKALFAAIERQWGKMRPQDARKLSRTLGNFLASGTAGIDPEAYLQALADKGVTFGQFLQMVEPRQALKLQALAKRGNKAAQDALDSPLGQMLGFRRGLAEKSADQVMQGYPAAIAKVAAAWATAIEALDKGGVIDKFASGLTALAESITRVVQGEGSLGDWATSLAAAAPLIAPVALAIGGLATAFTGLAAAVRLAVGALAALPLASLASLAGGAGAGAAAGAAGAGASAGAGAATGGAAASWLARLKGAPIHPLAGPASLIGAGYWLYMSGALGERVPAGTKNRDYRRSLRDALDEQYGMGGASPAGRHLDELKSKSEEAGRALDGVSGKVCTPTIDTQSLDAAIGKVDELMRKLRGVGGTFSPSVTPKIGPAPSSAPAPDRPKSDPVRSAALNAYSDYYPRGV